MKCISKGIVPSKWKSGFISASNVSIGTWIADLSARCGAFETFTNKAEAPVYWLGGMFMAEAFITATRQNTAQVTSEYIT